MSWSINYTSKDKQSLKATVKVEQYMPDKLKQLLCDQVDVVNVPAPESRAGHEITYAIRVASSGHHDSNYCYGDFKVELTRVVEA